MYRFTQTPVSHKIGRLVKDLFNPFQPITLPSNMLLWDFSVPRDRAEWNVTSDATFGGVSTAALDATSDSILFAGNLSQAIPPGSNLVRSGFAAIRSKKYPKNPLNPQVMRLQNFDAIEFLVRGDGRTYIANITTESLQEDDVYQQFMYTKGGNEWERIRLPFSKFLLTNRGYVQNEQQIVNTSGIRTVGVSLSDGLDGPFKLEIKAISALPLVDRMSEKVDNFPHEHIKASYTASNAAISSEDADKENQRDEPGRPTTP